MTTAFVSSLAALCITEQPSLRGRVQDVKAILQQKAVRYGPGCNNRFTLLKPNP
jgi:hypothetical protein